MPGKIVKWAIVQARVKWDTNTRTHAAWFEKESWDTTIGYDNISRGTVEILDGKDYARGGYENVKKVVAFYNDHGGFSPNEVHDSFKREFPQYNSYPIIRNPGKHMRFDEMAKKKRNIIPAALVDAASYSVAATALEKARGLFKSKRYKGRKKKNPGVDEATEISEGWHGREVRKITKILESETFEDTVAELADLDDLGILDPQMETYHIEFSKKKPKICATSVSNIEFIGGDQHLELGDVGVESDGKVLVPLGYSYYVNYTTDKFHLEGSNGYPEGYQHFWGEEFYKENIDDQENYDTSDDWFDACLDQGLVEEAIELGLLPMVVYNKTDCKILLVGGKYKVTDLGIEN